MRTRHHITIDICATSVALLALVGTITVQTPIEKSDGTSGTTTVQRVRKTEPYPTTFVARPREQLAAAPRTSDYQTSKRLN